MAWWTEKRRQERQYGFHYSVLTKDGWINESFLPGIRIPERIEDMLYADWAEEYGLCGSEAVGNLCCLNCKAHPLDENGYKYCTVLFHDAVNPKWKIKDLI